MSVVLQPRPHPGAPSPAPFPPFERTTLPNGVTLLTCHVTDRPIAEVRFILPGGAHAEPHPLPGVAATAAGAVVEGTQGRDGERFALDLELLGARLSLQPMWTTVLGALSAPVAKLPEALALATEAISQPAFRDDDVERLRRQHLGMLASARRVPQQRARMTLEAAMFAPTARMAAPMIGTPTGVENVTPDDVRRYWACTAVPSGCTVIVVGDMRNSAIEGALASTVGMWSALDGGTPSSSWPADAASGAPGVSVVNVPGAVQTIIALGGVGARVPIQERAALRVATHYLGGFFGSRLNVALREERAIAYGAGAGVDHRRVATAWTAESSVQTDATVEAAATVFEELRAAADARMHDEVFRQAVEHLVRTSAINRMSAAAIAGALTSLVIEELPDDYFDDVASQMAATTADAAAAALARNIPIDNLRLVAVGDAERIQGGLADLGWGELSVEELV